MSEIGKYFIVFVFIVIVACNQELQDERQNQHQRVRRALKFQNNTRILFRVNVKENIYKVNQIFAHAYGFRANIDLLQPARAHIYPRPHVLKRRDVYSTIEQLLSQQGFDGRACIFKMLCDAYEQPTTPESGMFFKLFKLIFTHRHSEDEYEGVNIPHLLKSGCKYLEDHCPLTLLDLTPYTDVGL